MPTEELGASAYQKIDIEAWMPGRKSWGEVSFTDFIQDIIRVELHRFSIMQIKYSLYKS